MANWENVYVFISSTFNDMHAERDYLIKQVFPELRIWCARRKLKLIDIDLRWGISQADATENKRVVEVCLQNIDKCRPFFLGFMGQRRGWVPEKADVNQKTMELFPELSEYLGQVSVTELEVIHALLNPFAQKESVAYASFYFRSPNYVKSIKEKDVKQLYAPSGGLLMKSDKKLEQFKKQLKRSCNVNNYSARWNPDLHSPELKNIDGKDLSSGRLEHFMVEDSTLKEHVIGWLKESIAQAFPGHVDEEKEQMTDLERELSRQDTALFAALETYIPRKDCEEAILQYEAKHTKYPLMITADAGVGKTTLLSAMIHAGMFEANVYYRLIGVSEESSAPERVVQSVLEQMAADGLLEKEEIEKPDDLLLSMFYELLEKAGKKKQILLILDGIDQFSLNNENDYWIPEILPQGIDMICSLKNEGNEQRIDNLHRLGLARLRMPAMSDMEMRRQLVSEYLGQFLKAVDDAQMNQILDMPGSANPLYLKIVLNELRVHGSFETLMEKLSEDYGDTPRIAFGRVIDRLTAEQEDVSGKELIQNLLGMLAYALEPLAVCKAAEVLACQQTMKNQMSVEEIKERIYVLVQQLSPYLMREGDQVAYRYDSLRLAVTDSFPERQESFHFMLVQYYSAGEGTGEERMIALKQMLYHVAREMPDEARTLLDSYTFVTETIERVGTILVAKCYEDFGGRCPDYREIGKSLKSAARRLNVGPHTLCMELEKSCRMDHPVLQVLKKGREEKKDWGYFAAQSGAGERQTVLKEHVRLGRDISYLEMWGNYFVIVENRKVTLKNRVTLETEHVKVFHESFEVQVVGDELCLHFTPWSARTAEQEWIEIYELPYFKLIEKVSGLGERPEGFRCWDTHWFERKMYRYYRHDLTDATEIKLVEAETGKIIYEETVPMKGRYRETDSHGFYQQYAIIYASAASVKIVNLLTGGILWEEDVDIEANLRCVGMGEELVVYFSGIHKNSQGEYEGQTIFYRFQVRKEMVVLQKKVEYSGEGPGGLSLSMSADYVFLMNYGRLYVLNHEFQVIGMNEMQTEERHESWSESWRQFDKQLILLEDNGARFYGTEDVISSLSAKKPEKRVIGKCPWTIWENNLYLMKRAPIIWNLDSGQKIETENPEEFPAMQYDLSQNLRFYTGYQPLRNMVVVWDKEKAEFVCDFVLKNMENRVLEYAFYIGNDKVAVVLSGKEVHKGKHDTVCPNLRIYDCREKEAKLLNTYAFEIETPPFSTMLQDSKQSIYEINPDLHMLIFPETYADGKKKIRMLHVEKAGYSYQKETDQDGWVDAVKTPAGICFYSRKENGENELIFIDTKKFNCCIYQSSFALPQIGNRYFEYEGKVMLPLLSLGKNSIEIYSQQTNKVEKEIELIESEEKYVTKMLEAMQTGVLFFGGKLMVYHQNGRIDFYDYESGKYLMSQQMDQELSELKVYEKRIYEMNTFGEINCYGWKE